MKLPDYYQLPNSDRIVASTAIDLLPAAIASQARPVFFEDNPPVSVPSGVGAWPRMSATGDAGASVDVDYVSHGPRGLPANLRHRPRYFVVHSEAGDSDPEEGDSFSAPSSQANIPEMQTYHENMKAIRHLMGLTHMPDSIDIPLPTHNPYGEVPTEEVVNLKLPSCPVLMKKLKAVNDTVAKGFFNNNRQNSPLPANKLVKTARFGQFYEMFNPYEGESSVDIESLPSGPEF